MTAKRGKQVPRTKRSTSKKKKSKKKVHTGGKPEIELTAKIRKQVHDLAGFGMTWPMISNVVQVSQRTLQRRCITEYRVGRSTADGAVLQTLYNMATSGKVPGATIFYTKARLGWKETQKVEHSGSLEATREVLAKAIEAIREESWLKPEDMERPRPELPALIAGRIADRLVKIAEGMDKKQDTQAEAAPGGSA